ncbi:uncharacterized protein LOC110931785 [Helianthus annuus]|uniref:uncharacterized protein LOC110931785 n=1 Tax=Helianthus annuus TaxID=4232 RepID=UPI000B8F6019|nr:uncharacterized protein LOC110931785 [Helianthus annuus]
MDSPTSSSSIANYYYKNFLADEGDSTDEEVEQEAVTSACELAARYSKHCSEPQREILPREYIQQDRQAANDRLIKDYFAEEPTYPNPEVFRRRFRMSKRLFLRIVEDLENTYDYFKQKADAKKDLWVWSAYFGVAGSCNDLNVFKQSPLVEDYISGRAAKASFYANRNYYPHGYYLCDGIYPKYSIFVRTFRDPYNEKRAHFKKVQESSRKDIERCFGVLQQRWHYLRNPCRAWSKEKMRDAMYTCIIIHNMILEDEGKAIYQNYVPKDVQKYPQATMEERVKNAHELRSEVAHNELAFDLVEHAWSVRYIPNEGEQESDDEDDGNGESEDEN